VFETQRLKPSSAGSESYSVAPKPPPDPNRQLSRAGSRPRGGLYQQQLALSGSQSPISPDSICTRLKSESLSDGTKISQYLI